MLFVILCPALQNFSCILYDLLLSQDSKGPLSKFLQVFSSDSSLFSNMFLMAGGKSDKQGFNAHFCSKYNLKLFN